MPRSPAGKQNSTEPDAQLSRFADLLFHGKRATDAFVEVFPDRAAGMNYGTLATAAHYTAKKQAVVDALQLMRQELLDAGIWTREEAARTLSDLAKNGDTSSSRVAASRELNQMFGHHAPAQVQADMTYRFILERAADHE